MLTIGITGFRDLHDVVPVPPVVPVFLPDHSVLQVGQRSLVLSFEEDNRGSVSLPSGFFGVELLPEHVGEVMTA